MRAERTAEPYHTSLARLLLSPKGRISRSEAWLRGTLACEVLSILVSGVTVAVAAAFGYSEPAVSILMPVNYLVFPLLVWASFALCIKRLHDRNKSALWLLILLIPIAGLIIAVEVGLLPGTVGPNRFGGDPLERARAENKWPIGGVPWRIAVVIALWLPWMIANPMGVGVLLYDRVPAATVGKLARPDDGGTAGHRIHVVPGRDAMP